jgi:hypothetical protein
MGMLMSFLVVARVKITYDNYMAASGYLNESFKACRELAHHTILLSMQDKSARARQWRQDVVYSAIVLLRVTVAVLEFKANPEQGAYLYSARYGASHGMPCVLLNDSLSLLRRRHRAMGVARTLRRPTTRCQAPFFLAKVTVRLGGSIAAQLGTRPSR